MKISFQSYYTSESVVRKATDNGNMTSSAERSDKHERAHKVALMLEAASTSEASVDIFRIHGRTSQKTVWLFKSVGHIPRRKVGRDSETFGIWLFTSYFVSYNAQSQNGTRVQERSRN